MGNMRYNNKTKTQEQTSGISKLDKLPKVLPYPYLLPFESTESIHNLFCYVIKHYGNYGISVLIYRHPESDQIITICGDWFGNNLDIVNNNDELSKVAMSFCNDKLLIFVEIMKLIKIDQAQFFFAINNNDLMLVDIQIAYNKLASPGMVRDIFNNIYNTQEVIKTEIIDERAIEAIKKGTGSYEGDIILKPSRFRMFHNADNNSFKPLYVEVKR